MNIFEEIEVESLVRYLRERALGEKTLKRQLTGNLNTANWINKIKSKKHHAGDAKDNSNRKPRHFQDKFLLQLLLLPC